MSCPFSSFTTVFSVLTPGLLELAISVSITGEEEELTRSSLQTGPAGQGEATRVITSLAGLLGNIHRNKIYSKLKYIGAPHHRFSPCIEVTYPYDIKNQRKARNTPSRGLNCLELLLFGIRELA